MIQRPDVDWDAVRLDYEAGVLSDRAIGKKHGVSHVAIGKRAKTEKWTRSLKEKIRARAEQKVTTALVTRSVTSKGASGKTPSETKVIEVNSDLLADIILRHRGDIIEARNNVRRFRDICVGLTEELALRSMTEEQRLGMVDMIVQMQTGADPKVLKQAVDAFMGAIDLGERSTIARQLWVPMQGYIGALETLIKLERTVLGIEDAGKSEDDYESRLARLYGTDAA